MRRIRPVHTYSIVARDPASGEMGVAVPSHWFSIGSVVPWAEVGEGAVAKRMRSGMAAPDALKALPAADPG